MTTRWVLVITLPPDCDLPGQAGRHEAGSRGPGDATWDLVTDSDDPAALERLVPPGVTVVARVALERVASRTVAFDGLRIKRTLLVRANGPPGVVAQFEASLAAMPDHIDAIRSWALSRVDPVRSTGAWTHVWEQEFAALDGLRHDYMHHPYHWTGVERWFDPEIPGSIVDPDLAHLIRTAPGPVLGVA